MRSTTLRALDLRFPLPSAFFISVVDKTKSTRPKGVSGEIINGH